MTRGRLPGGSTGRAPCKDQGPELEVLNINYCSVMVAVVCCSDMGCSSFMFCSLLLQCVVFCCVVFGFDMLFGALLLFLVCCSLCYLMLCCVVLCYIVFVSYVRAKT